MGVPPIPFAHRSRYGDSIASLLMQRGDIAARGAAASGQIWGNAVNQLGQIGAHAYQGYQADKAAKQQEEVAARREAAFGQALEDPAIWENPQVAVRALHPFLGKDVFGVVKSMQDYRELEASPDPDKAREALPGMVRSILLMPEDKRPGAYSGVRKLAINAGLTTEEGAPPDYSPDLDPWLESIGQGLDPQTGTQGKKYKVTVPGPDGPITRLATEEEMMQGVTEYEEPPDPMAAEMRRLRLEEVRKRSEPEQYHLNPETGVVLTTIPMKDKNRVQKEANERGLPAWSTGAAQTKGVLLGSIYAEALELQELFKDDDVRLSIGPVMGRLTAQGGKLTGLPPKVRRAAQLMYGLSDTELRKRSGAQINEKEMVRLLRFTTDPTRPVDHNVVAVEGLLKSASRDYRALSGVNPPGRVASLQGAQAPEAEVDVDEDALLKKYGY